MFRQKDADMTQGVIWRQLVQFAIPMAIGLLFQQLYNTVDIIVVGQFVGKEALAAVGSTSSAINTLVGFATGLSTGSSVIISQRYGARDRQGLHNAVHTTMALTFIISAVGMVAGQLIVGLLMKVMATPPDVMDETETYLRIYFAGLAGLFMYNMGASILRAVGDSRRPLYFLCFSAVVNTVLDLVFVLWFKLGVAGVAYATIIAQFLSAVLVLGVLTREKADYGIRWRDIRLDRALLRRILSLGLPSAVQQGVTAFSNVFVQSYVNFFGSACMAGWAAYNKLDVFLSIPIQSIAMASSTFVGQNWGAKKPKRARQGVARAAVMSVGVTLALSAVIVGFADFFISLFTGEADVAAYGVRFVRMMSPFYIGMGLSTIHAGALRGVGNAKWPMYIMLFSYVLVRQIYLFTVKALGNSLTWIAMGYPIGWMLCALLLWLVYRRSALFDKAKEELA